MNKKIINARIVTPEIIITGEIGIENGLISAVGKKIRSGKSEAIIDARGKYVLPGFVDIHTNGANGFDISCGKYNEKTRRFSLARGNYLTGLQNAMRFYLAAGTTRVLLSSISAPLENLLNGFGYVSEFKKSGGKYSEVLGGIYVEGSFIKDSASRGAQNPNYFIRPEWAVIKNMNRAAEGLISVVNIPPEWNLGKLTRKISERGIICAVGHSSAGGDEFASAIKNGAVLATHFLNGPSSASFKPFGGGGVVEAVLKSEDVFAEIIPDGYHIDKSYVLDVIARKGCEKIIAVSDSMFVTGLAGMKSFFFLSVEGDFGGNREYIFVKRRPNALFGSVLTMDRAFSNLLTWMTEGNTGVWNKNHKALPFETAMRYASAMCSSNPAGLLTRFNRKESFGKIESGCRADLIIADVLKRGNAFTLRISERMLGGEKITL